MHKRTKRGIIKYVKYFFVLMNSKKVTKETLILIKFYKVNLSLNLENNVFIFIYCALVANYSQ